MRDTQQSALQGSLPNWETFYRILPV